MNHEWRKLGNKSVTEIEQLIEYHGTANVRIATDGTVEVNAPLPPVDKTESYSEQEVAAAHKEQKFPVLEIFGPTLQGEGMMIGVQTMFIRFGGCDYRCTKCDSLHAVLPALIKEQARYLTATEIRDEVLAISKHCRVVTFSGGNPCMWDLTKLVDLLHEHRIGIAVETQGTIWRDWIAKCEWVTVSPKGPGMGEQFEEDKFQNFGRMIGRSRVLGHSAKIAIKVVIFDQLDIEFAKQIKTLTQRVPFYLSVGNPYPPVPGKDETRRPKDLAATLLHRMSVLYEDIQNEPLLHDAIFLPQMHVLLWANDLGR